MDRNVKIARDLVRLAKSMVAGFYSTEINREVNTLADFKDMVKSIIADYIGTKYDIDETASAGDDFSFLFFKEVNEDSDFYSLDVNIYSISATECRIDMQYSFQGFTDPDLDKVIAEKYANIDWTDIQDSQECRRMLEQHFGTILKEAKSKNNYFEDDESFPEFKEDFF